VVEYRELLETVSPDPEFASMNLRLHWGRCIIYKRFIRYIGLYLCIANSRMLQKLRNTIIIKADGLKTIVDEATCEGA
jgi:hypothetical protein